MTPPNRSPNFLAELEVLDTDVAALLELPSDRLTRRPAPGKWSALQGIEHIVCTNREFFPHIHAAIQRAHATNRYATEPFQYSWTGQRIVALFEPPPKLRLPLPTRRIAPVVDLDVQVVRRSYEESHTLFRKYILEAMTIDLRGVKVRSPFLIERWMPLTLGTVIGALLAHERRHMYQARRAID